jgi:hypothetical protein
MPAPTSLEREVPRVPEGLRSSCGSSNQTEGEVHEAKEQGTKSFQEIG